MFYEAGGAEELQFRAPIHAGASCFIRVEGLKNFSLGLQFMRELRVL